MECVPQIYKEKLFYFILFYFILFYFISFHFILLVRGCWLNCLLNCCFRSWSSWPPLSYAAQPRQPIQPTQRIMNCSSTFTLPYFASFFIKQYIHNHLPLWPNSPYFGWRIQFRTPRLHNWCEDKLTPPNWQQFVNWSWQYRRGHVELKDDTKQITWPYHYA
jgi:hypothetical protein